MLKVLVTAALVFGGAQVFAHEGHEGKGHGEGPCKALREACKGAGFEKGMHKEGKGLIMDCMAKVGAGEKVEGIAFDPAAAENKACMDHLAKMKEHRDEKKAEKKAAKDAAKTSH